MDRIKVYDMTRLFKKEMLLYSLGRDIRFDTPIRIRLILYVFFNFLIIGGTYIYFLGLPKGPFSLVLVAGIPVALGNFMARPIFNGRPFFSAMGVWLKYLYSKKIYFDLKSSNKLKNYIINDAKLISRKKDYIKVFESKYKE